MHFPCSLFGVQIGICAFESSASFLPNVALEFFLLQELYKDMFIAITIRTLEVRLHWHRNAVSL